jgi:hypothetical protein
VYVLSIFSPFELDVIFFLAITIVATVLFDFLIKFSCVATYIELLKTIEENIIVQMTPF